MSKLNFRIFLIEDNGSYAELECEDLGSEFTTSFSTTDITNISTRTDNISKNITLKATPVNNRVLGNLYNLSRFSDTTLPERLYYNFSPNRGVQCQIFEDSVMIFKGTLKVTGVDCDINGNYTYSAVVIGNLINFLGKIGNDMLSDVFVIDYQHTYTLPTIINSWDKNYTDGLAFPYKSFFYPQIDYGKGIVPNRTKFDMRNFRTGVYLSGYFDNIFSNYGYTYSGNFINSDIFQKAFVPYNEPEFSKKTKEIVYSDVATSVSTYAFSPEAPSSPIYLGQFVDNSIIKRVIRTYGGVDVHTYVLTRNVTSQITLNLNYTAVLTEGLGSDMDVVLLQVDTAGSPNISTAKPLSYSVASGSTTLTLPLKTYLKDEGFAIIANSNADSASLTINNGEFKIGAAGLVSQVDIISGDTVNVRDVVPQNVLVKDFLKNILTFFNLFLIENPNIPNGIIIEPFDTFYQKALNPAQYAYDWTKKVDLKSGTKLTFNTQLPTAYNFKFKEDSDDYYGSLYSDKYNETYGDFSIKNSKGIADVLDVEVLFSSTIVVKENGDDKVLPAIFKGELTAKESYKSNIRLLFNNGKQTCATYDIVTTSGTSEAISYTTLASGINQTNLSSTILKDTDGNDVFNLLFGVPNEVYMPVTQSIFTLPNIYTDFYENQILELNDDNVLVFELSVLLSASDIANLDLRNPVFIQTKSGGVYAKILNVDYYNSSELSQVKLQKIVL